MDGDIPGGEGYPVAREPLVLRLGSLGCRPTDREVPVGVVGEEVVVVLVSTQADDVVQLEKERRLEVTGYLRVKENGSHPGLFKKEAAYLVIQ